MAETTRRRDMTSESGGERCQGADGRVRLIGTAMDLGCAWHGREACLGLDTLLGRKIPAESPNPIAQLPSPLSLPFYRRLSPDSLLDRPSTRLAERSHRVTVRTHHPLLPRSNSELPLDSWVQAKLQTSWSRRATAGNAMHASLGRAPCCPVLPALPRACPRVASVPACVSRDSSRLATADASSSPECTLASPPAARRPQPAPGTRQPVPSPQRHFLVFPEPFDRFLTR
ncbi:zinc finger C3HC4-type RING finger family protein [Striga asiatica]|uniref:Zinc finger C3HC4-type RING finger family protein n=1 Tax=Striga asiatica TaxID=4170 RepID=A0A5A7NYJ2_STRAF|nr:zinc finger C3HC4-type RING finger family protein [Striga asiatica]